jgi:UDP-N-acetylmuramate dehydrogenase
MDIQENVSLHDFSTMRLGGAARYLTTVTERQQISEAVTWAKNQNVSYMMIGGGSNIIWRDEGYPGLIIVNRIQRFEDFAEDETNHYVTVGAGEPWDSVVERTVAAGLTGIECLSLIPGTTGGTPVQNVGAYGQEIANTLMSVEAYDSQTNQIINIPASDCQFGYRSSRFKHGDDKGRFLISAVTLHLSVGNPLPPFYASLAAMLEERQISNPTPAQVRDCVIAIRNIKLPDPAVVANNGSFFANPIVDAMDFFELTERLEMGTVVPHWEMPDGRVKLAAGWLVEQAGFKGVHDSETGMATWDQQALVLVNEHAKSTADLLAFRQKILDAVRTKFGVTLEQEPELLP